MNTLKLFKSVTSFIFDMDGVLTDGSLLLLKEGFLARKMNIKDGYAIQLAIKKGYRILVISGSNSVEVQLRLEKLGVSEIFMNVTDKMSFLKTYSTIKEIDLDSALYMGDDIPDLASMKVVLLACCPADAAPEIKQASKYISLLNGGYGCARDVIEKVLKLNNNWDIGTTACCAQPSKPPHLASPPSGGEEHETKK